MKRAFFIYIFYTEQKKGWVNMSTLINLIVRGKILHHHYQLTNEQLSNQLIKENTYAYKSGLYICYRRYWSCFT